MLKSSRKKMIAIGCSYTGDWNSFSSWPNHLAEKLGMKYINLGLNGAGNEYMLSKLLDTTVIEKKEDIGLVVIMWSEWQRLDFQFRRGAETDCIFGNTGWINLHPHRDNSKNQRYPINREGRIALLEHNNIISATMRSLRFFLMAQKLLGDIPYLMIQGCNPLIAPLFLYPENEEGIWKRFTKIRKRAINIIIDSSITEEINEKKFIGWPIMQEIGGYSVDDILDNIDPERKQLRISEEDTHPNGEGHKVIAKEIYNEYKKIYT